METKELPIEVARISLLNKVVFAWKLLTDMRVYDGQIMMLDKRLELDTRAESYRMLIANYLVALVGQGKNDRISLYNKPIESKKQQIEKFYADNAADIKKLTKIRDKIYAHFDTDCTSTIDIIPFGLIKNLIDNLVTILDYKAPVLPRA